MKKYTLKDTVELIGITAIVASLIFVGLQLQQDRLLVRSEVGAGSLEFSATVHLAMSDPDMSDAWAKMLDQPQSLTPSEILRIDSYLEAVRSVMLRECYLMAMGVFVECEALVQGLAAKYFANEFAQTWWRNNNNPNPVGTDDLINAVVTDVHSSGTQ
jgi:hypothetical protein